jgi:recombination protein RecA
MHENGFVSDARTSKFSKFGTSDYNSNLNGVPNVGKLLRDLYMSIGATTREDHRLFDDYMSGRANPSRERLQKILTALEGRCSVSGDAIMSYLQTILDLNYIFSEVVSTETEKGVPTFDVCLPETHSFWSNGMISHNTTLAIHAAIQCQKGGGSVVFLDFEHAFAPTYAADLGLELQDEDFLLMQPKHWEEGAEIIKAMAEAGVDLIIVDSVAAMKPQRDVEDNDVSSTGQVGHIARLQSSFLPKIVNTIEESNTALLYLNQLRSRIKTSMYDTGPDEETSGGRALKYFASLRMKLKRCRTEYAQVESELTGKSEKQPISNMIRAKNVKNKVSRHQGHSGEFVIRYGEGVDNVRSVIDIADARKVITRAGAWYSFTDISGEEVKVQGKEALRDHFIENPEDFQAVVGQVSSFSKGFDKAGKVSDDDIEVEDHDD